MYASYFHPTSVDGVPQWPGVEYVDYDVAVIMHIQIWKCVTEEPKERLRIISPLDTKKKFQKKKPSISSIEK